MITKTAYVCMLMLRGSNSSKVIYHCRIFYCAVALEIAMALSVRSAVYVRGGRPGLVCPFNNAGFVYERVYCGSTLLA